MIDAGSIPDSENGDGPGLIGLDKPNRVMYNQRVALLVDQQARAGNYQTVFNASRLASGLYFCVMRAGDRQLKQKMLLLK